MPVQLPCSLSSFRLGNCMALRRLHTEAAWRWCSDCERAVQLFKETMSTVSIFWSKWPSKSAKSVHGLHRMPIWCFHDMSTGLQFFKSSHNKIVEATAPVNPFKNFKMDLDLWDCLGREKPTLLKLRKYGTVCYNSPPSGLPYFHFIWMVSHCERMWQKSKCLQTVVFVCIHR